MIHFPSLAVSVSMTLVQLKQGVGDVVFCLLFKEENTTLTNSQTHSSLVVLSTLYVSILSTKMVGLDIF